MVFSLNVSASIPSKSFLLWYPHSSTSNRPPSFLAFPQSTHFTSIHRPLSLQNAPKHSSRPFHVTCVENNETDLDPDLDPLSSLKEAKFDVKLPRRSMIVQFTCNSCGERTQRLINRLAYERGTVFVQCAGCFIHHKLVDNLELVVEYDLREVDANGEGAD